MTTEPAIDVDAICPMCGAETIVTMRIDSYQAWIGGEPIQRAAPELTPEQRERLISGTCPDCWAVMERILNDD